jgi:hypothetical protein
MRPDRIRISSAVLLGALLVSCGPSGPRRPQPGTPAFFWTGAQTAYQQGNYSTALAELEKAAVEPSEYQARAKPWAMMIAGGLARGDMDWADMLEAAIKKNPRRETDYRRAIFAARNAANQAAMRFAELGHKYLEVAKDAEAPLAFALPVLEEDPPELERLERGLAMKPVELDKIHTWVIRRGVQRAAARAATGSEDVAKAKAALGEAGDAKVAGKPYVLYLAGEYVAIGELYGPKKLYQAARVRMLCQEAQEALDLAKDAEAAKPLKKQIEAQLKKLPKSAT